MKKINKQLACLRRQAISNCTIIIFLLFTKSVFADYVLPYPSFMPGNKLYRLETIKDKLEEYWSWGTLSSFKYHQKLTDKYLVEAKTLFEYKQYPLALNALKKSDDSFKQLMPLLVKAGSEGKDISQFLDTLNKASLKHQEILNNLKNNLPSQYSWAPEKENPQNLPISSFLEKSIKIRKKI